MLVFHVIETRHYAERGGAYGTVETISHGASTDWKQAKAKEEIARHMEPVDGCKSTTDDGTEWEDDTGGPVYRQLDVIEVMVQV